MCWDYRQTWAIIPGSRTKFLTVSFIKDRRNTSGLPDWIHLLNLINENTLVIITWTKQVKSTYPPIQWVSLLQKSPPSCESKGAKGPDTPEDFDCFHGTAAINHIKHLATYFRQKLQQQISCFVDMLGTNECTHLAIPFNLHYSGY